MDQRISRVAMRVRGYHLDGYGHVNNARYLEFLEEGRWRYFDDRPTLVRHFATVYPALVAFTLNVNYRQPVVALVDLEVHTRICGVGSKRSRMLQAIWRICDCKLVADAPLTFM